MRRSTVFEVGEPAREELEGRTIGSYRVVRLLGAGAMGKVYLIEHARLPNTFAALKVLSPRKGNSAVLRERFVQEAMVAAAIGGDRVARPLDIGQLDADTPYIVMEYVEGRTVADLIDAGGPLPVAQALAIAYRVADTIALAHARGIVHRDVKPSNIMLTDEAQVRVKVLDFGVARAEGDIKIAQTLESAVIGSPGYMSPEAATGMSVDERTDVFSLGVTLFKMLTASLPFAGDNPQATVAAILTQPPRRLAEARPATLDAPPPALEALLSRTLHKSAAERPRMSELRDALFALVAEIDPERARALRSPRTPVPARLAPELDVLGSTLHQASDASVVRAQAERFAAARLGVARAVSTASLTAASRRPLVAALLLIVLVAGVTWVLATRRAAPPSHRAARHVEPVQRKITTLGNIGEAAISPDGALIAYSSGGTVYFRDLDGGHVRAVGDRPGRGSFVWSGDGSAFYYHRHTSDAEPMSLVRVPRDGGPTTRVTAFDHHYVDFTRDGKEAALSNPPARAVVITDGAGKELRQLPLDGKFTWLDLASWSPSGDRLLVTTIFDDRGYARLMTRDGARQVPLSIEHLADISWYDDRALLVLRSPPNGLAADLLLQPLDESGLRAAGEARLLLPSLRGSGLSVTRDGRRAVYVAANDESGAAIWSVTVGDDGRPRAQKLPLGTAMTCAASVSPDGGRIALSTSDGEGVGLTLLPFDGGTERPLARLPLCVAATWSPDGKQLAWRDGASLIVQPVDGGPARKIPLIEASGNDPSVAWPRADRVLYHVEGHRQWSAVDLTSGKSAPITDDKHGWYFAPMPAPDGEHVAVMWNRRDSPGVWVLGLDGNARFVSGPSDLYPTGWSGDGKSIYVVENPRPDGEHPLTILKLPSGGGAPTPWLTMPFSNRATCHFARDGKRAVCTEQSTRTDLWIVENFGELVDAARD